MDAILRKQLAGSLLDPSGKNQLNGNNDGSGYSGVNGGTRQDTEDERPELTLEPVVPPEVVDSEMQIAYSAKKLWTKQFVEYLERTEKKPGPMSDYPACVEEVAIRLREHTEKAKKKSTVDL